MDWRCTGQGKAGLGRTWLGREGLVLVCQQNRGSQDRHRLVLRIGVLLVYVVYLDIKCLSLPYPVLPGFARSCPNLPRPIRTQFALSWPSPILTGSVLSNTAPPAARPVLLTTPGPVRSSPALLNTDRPFVVLPGPSRPCLVLSGAALFHSAWRCPARYLLLSHGRLCTNLPGPALLCQFCNEPPSLALLQGRTQEGREAGPPWDLKNTIYSGFLPLNYAI